MELENFLYFAEAVVETGDDGQSEACMIPASSYIGADPGSATVSTFKFRGQTGDDDSILRAKFTHKSGAHKEVVRALGACMNANPQKGGFVRVFDMETGTAVKKNPFINPLFNGLDISNLSLSTVGATGGTVEGVEDGTVRSNSFGSGFKSTFSGGPTYSRTMVGDLIYTTIKIDLTGLKAKGGNAGDAVGVGTTPAYIYKNKVSENGLLFSQRITCLEVPTAASGTLTTDLNLAWNSAATVDYDEAAGTGSEINAGVLAITDSVELAGTPITANHYAYITEGDTTAANCVFSGGQYLITLIGTKLPVAL
jgi:hypothetical protein